MGLFDFFKSKPKTTSTHDNRDFAKSMREDYKATKKEVEKLQMENAAWQKDFDIILNFRKTASSFEKEGKLQEAINEYSKSVSFGETNQRLNLNNYVHDIERLIVLYNKTKQKDKLINFLDQLIAKYPEYSDVQKWAVRLSSLSPAKSNPINLNPSALNKQHSSNPTIGKTLQAYRDTFPKFNFYYDMPAGMNTMEYLSIRNPVPFEKSVGLGKFKMLLKQF